MQLYSLSHIIYLLICTIICITLYFILKSRSKKTQYITTLSILTISFVIHFLKLLIPVYKNALPNSLISITPETLCAISTLAFPFIFISKSKSLKDYMVVFGILSGILTLLFPGDIIGLSPFNIEVIRFFFSHLTIFMCPLFTFAFSIHTPTKHWLRNTLLILFLMINIIILDHLFFAFALDGQEGLDSLVNGIIN